MTNASKLRLQSETPHTDRLLASPVFGLPAAQKRSLFMEAINEAFHLHMDRCPAFNAYCARRGVGANVKFNAPEDLPFLPVHAFKAYGRQLRSVPQEAIQTTLQSSATGGVASTVLVDRVTARRQVQALTGVLATVMGGKRRPFLVCDIDPTKAPLGALGARAAAVRGFLNLAREARYALKLSDTGGLEIDHEVVSRFRNEVILKGEPFAVFGFTYVLYADVMEPLLLGPAALHAPAGIVAHIGGWKKLEDRKVSRGAFEAAATQVFGVEPEKVIDFYGFTEQMGVTYPSIGPDGERITPAYAEVVVRDPHTLKPVPDGVPGLLQFVSPLPYSYPGLAVLTDDIGVVTGRTLDPQLGFTGTRFKVLGRAKNAEVRGCGDIMADKVLRAQPHAAGRANKQAAKPKVLFRGGLTIPMHRAMDDIDLEALPEADLDALCDEVIEARAKLQSYSIDDRIAVIAAAAQTWGDPDSPLAALRTQGLAFLQSWCAGTKLRRIMDEGLRGRRGVVDEFKPSAVTGRQIRAIPRPLCVHWLAGNVPLLGMLALVQCIAIGSANVLKAASSFAGALPALLESLRLVEIRTRDGRTLRGADLTASVAVVYFSRDDRVSAEIISKRADARIAWGGRDAVETIVSLPKRFDCEDVIYGPKLSFMAIGREQLSNDAALKRVARRAATDSSVFDQYACASPHTIFVERGGAFEPRAFAEKLAAEMGLALLRIPKVPIDGGTAAKVTSARLDYELGGRGTAWCSPGTEWTVLYDDDYTMLADPVYSRVIHVRPVDDILHAALQAHPDIQTIGLALDGERRHVFADLASQRGAVRFPEVGRMTEFDVAWDGLYLADRIVRWVVLGGPFS